MLTGALGTYAAALIVTGASTAIGAGILAVSGRREWSWSAPAVGLAAATIAAWWTVRLPGHGATALVTLLVMAAAGAALASARLDGIGRAAREGSPVLILALIGVSIPFVVEGHFGVLGTGFNVDMSQHLFAADWIADPSGPAPGLFEQGYPLGPHALAVATGEVAGELTTAFSGVTIAVPVIVALSALTGLERWPAWRASLAALLPAFAYLAASYFAQGSFKELFEIAFLIGFALWLGELRRGVAPVGAAVGVPGAVLAAGALYAYSSPGLAWIGGALVLWAVAELALRRGELGSALRSAAPAVAAALVLLAVLAAPELDRIADFGGSVGTVSESSRAEAPPRSAELLAARGTADAHSAGDRGEVPKFDNDLGNLFGQISPLEALGVWSSGDFRVAPGDGGVPALAFYLGAILGALALALGVAAAIRAGETALLAALAAAAAIWIAARIGSTPYTTAKALAVLGTVAMLIAVRGVLRPRQRGGLLERIDPMRTLVAVAFVAVAAFSSGLALANAPVGPRDYTPAVRDFNERFAGRPTLLLAPVDVIADEHGADFYGWELREAAPACVAAASRGDASSPAPAGFRLVVDVDGGSSAAPFRGLERIGERDGVMLWRVPRERVGAGAVSDPACP